MELSVSIEHAQEVLPRVQGDYEKAYYAGIILERWAQSQLAQDAPGYLAYDLFEKAMNCYDKAQPLSPPENDDAILRWNTCVGASSSETLRSGRDNKSKPSRPTSVITAPFEE